VTVLLYLCRHAQTASSAVDSFNGRGELLLTKEGRKQATRLGMRLRSIAFDAIFCSPLARTAETVSIAVQGRDAVAIEGLTEIDYGAWEGLSPAQARELDPARSDAWEADPAQTAPPAGETAAQVAERAVATVEEISRRFPEGRVLAVSHKATLRILAAALTGSPIARYRKTWSQDECALNLVEIRAGKPPFLRLWNDTAHLGLDPGRTTRGGH
jgi:broad specificity phosphatase PhoE